MEGEAHEAEVDVADSVEHGSVSLLGGEHAALTRGSSGIEVHGTDVPRRVHVSIVWRAHGQDRRDSRRAV